MRRGSLTCRTYAMQQHLGFAGLKPGLPAVSDALGRLVCSQASIGRVERVRNAALRAHMRTPPLVRVVRTDEAQCDGEARAEDAAGTLLWAAVRVRRPSTDSRLC